MFVCKNSYHFPLFESLIKRNRVFKTFKAIPLFLSISNSSMSRTTRTTNNSSNNNLLLSRSRIWSKVMSTTSSENGTTKCRQNFHPDCENAINKQINLELYASFVYLSMAYYFNQDDVALNGFYKYFKQSSEEERVHAEMLMKYQNARGGRIIMQSITKPDKDDWKSPAEAIKHALELERKLNQELLNLHDIASKHNDPHLEDFLEKCLDEQVTSIKQLADYSSNLKRVGVGLGEYVFDKEEFLKHS